jgi:hypothetical protein
VGAHGVWSDSRGNLYLAEVGLNQVTKSHWSRPSGVASRHALRLDEREVTSPFLAAARTTFRQQQRAFETVIADLSIEALDWQPAIIPTCWHGLG